MTTSEIRNLKPVYSFRAMFMWEQLTGKPFGLDGSLTETFYFFWCCLSAGNAEAPTLEDLEAAISEDPSIFVNFSEWLSKEIEARSTGGDKPAKKAKKK